MDPRRLLPALAVLTVASLLLTGWVAVREGPRAGDRAGDRARRVAAAGAAEARSAAARPEATDGRGTPRRAREVLRRWDRRRAAAWAAGDVDAVRALYAPGATVGRVDARMLASYVDRGLAVRGLRTQVLALRVLDASPDRFRLRVTDRVVGGEAVDDAGRAVPLPVDRPSERVLRLRRVTGQWRVAGVRDVG